MLLRQLWLYIIFFSGNPSKFLLYDNIISHIRCDINEDQTELICGQSKILTDWQEAHPYHLTFNKLSPLFFFGFPNHHSDFKRVADVTS